MNLINRAFPLFLCLLMAAADAPAAPLIPLQKGMTWIYEGTLEWQEASVRKIRKIRLTTKVIKAAARGKVRLAVVRDFPLELAWSENDGLPRYSVLIETETKLVRLRADNEEEALQLARKFLRRPDYRSADSIIYYPLLECARSRLAIKGLDPGRKYKCEQSRHQTNPDTETLDLVRGAGIISYHYEHLGSTEKVDLELKEIRFPKRIDKNLFRRRGRTGKK